MLSHKELDNTTSHILFDTSGFKKNAIKKMVIKIIIGSHFVEIFPSVVDILKGNLNENIFPQ